MTARERLSNRRECEHFAVEVGGLHYVCTIGRYADGRIGEVFITNHRTGSGADCNARDAAIAASIAIQFGADLETIRRALCRDADGRPFGPLGAALDRIAEETP